MDEEHRLSWGASIALGLTLSFASSLLCLGWLGSARPGSLGGNLGDETARLIGHSASRWFIVYSAAFVLPIFAIIAILRLSRLRGVLLRMSGFASVVAVFACYWPWRWRDVRDVFPVLLVVSVTPLLLLHLRGKWILTRWIGVLDLVLYFGVFAFLFTKILYVPVVLLLPVIALASSILWAREVKLAACA